MLAVGNCCYVAICSAAEGASSPTGGGEGWGISWQPHAYSLFNMECQKIDRVQPVVPRGQPHLPTRNRMMGYPARLQDGVPVIMKVIDLMPCREAGGRWKNTSNVPVCVRFATWNI